MKKLIFSIAAISALLVSCAKPEVSTGDNTLAGEKMVTVTFTAGVETKTHLASDEKSVIWQKDDEISVFANGNNYKFSLVAGEDQTEGTFTGEMSETDADATEFYALYPYDATATIDGAVITTKGVANNIPCNQYGSFPNNVAQSVAHAAAGDTFEFKLICALLGVTVPESMAGQVKTVMVSTNAGASTEAFIGGTNTITVAAEPTYTISGGQADIMTTNNSGLAAATYYLPVRPVSLSKGLRIKLTYVDGHSEYIFTGKVVELKRAQGIHMTIKPQPTYIFDDFESYDVTTAGKTNVGLSDYIKGNNNALWIVENPFKTEANPSDKVLVDDMHSSTTSTSGYLQLSFGSDAVKEKFPYAARDKFKGLRCKVYVGTSEYFPHFRYDVNGTYGKNANPSKVNGIETADLSEADVTALYKHNDWNLLEWNLSACGFSKTNFDQLNNFQIRVFVNYSDTNTSGAATETSTRVAYFDDIEFLY